MNERLKQEIEQQFTYFSDGAPHVPVVKLLRPEFKRIAIHFYNLAIADVKKEIEERRDFMYARYIKKGIACIEEYRYDQCVELLNFIDNLTK